MMSSILNERTGSVTFMVVVVLSLLTILGICGSSISRIELLISRNEAGCHSDFYISEGGVSREAQEIGNGGYPIQDIHTSEIIATDRTSNLPGPSPHKVAGYPYEFSIGYSGVSIPAKGYSAIAFNRYDYTIDVKKNESRIKSVYCKIGPKPNM
ncbi:MAG: hypothetical protein EHJ94_00645 [Deltaproteobacteria bacterium]|nr:MAG: hypothetical protein EHJ94_00645 [Deltaproteobacteria bacterium]